MDPTSPQCPWLITGLAAMTGRGRVGEEVFVLLEPVCCRVLIRSLASRPGTADPEVRDHGPIRAAVSVASYQPRDHDEARAGLGFGRKI